MDMLVDFNIVGWFLIASVGLVVGIVDKSERAHMSLGFWVAFCSIFLLTGALAANNYLGDTTITGTVYAVSKKAGDSSVKLQFSKAISAEIEPSNELLQSFEVAIFPTGSRQLMVLKNWNSIWRLKFDKRVIQIQLEPDRTYRFRVHRLFFRKNILAIEEIAAPSASGGTTSG